MQITHDLAIGGLQQVIVNLCRNIDRSRFDVTLLCLRKLGPFAEEIEQLGIKVLLLPQKEKRTDYLSFFKVGKILKLEDTQVIHTHNTQPLIDGTLGALLTNGKQRVIHTDHARQFPDKRRYMFAEWCMSHFVYKMVGVSDQTTRNLHQYEKIPRKKLMTIQNGIDNLRFQVTIDTQAKRQVLGIRSTGPVIGVISRLEKVKGITYLLRAMPAVLERIPSATLLVVGDGSEKDSLEAEAKQLGIWQNVLFTGPRHDIPEVFQVLDTYVLPSLSEGLPIGLLEAMAAGCPVVASNVGGIPSVITHAANGSLFPAGKPEKITEALLALLARESLRNKYSKNGRSTIKTAFSAQLMARQYEKLYSDN